MAGYGDLSEQKQPLMEDVLLRGFAPLVQSQELLDFGMDATTVTPIEEVSASQQPQIIIKLFVSCNHN